MTYIVLELFPEPFILTNMDGEVWKTDLETAKELAKECQQGMVVPLESNLMQDLWSCWYHHDIQRLNVYFNEQNTTT